MAILRMLAKPHGFYAEEPEKMWAIDAAADTVNDSFTKIPPLVMGKKFDEDGHKAYKAAVQTCADFIHKNLHSHQGHFLAGPELTMADFVAASFIFGCIFNEAFPMQEWAKGGQEIFHSHHNVKAYVERLQETFHHYLKHRPAAPM
jgi:glutathione S-transferase